MPTRSASPACPADGDAAVTTLEAVPQLRLGLAQVDATVGDLVGNAELVRRWARHAAERGVHLLAFPEMHLTGYPIEDLALRESFIAASQAALSDLAVQLAEDGLGGLAVVVGYLDRLDDAEDGEAVGRPRGSPQNAFAVVHGGRVVARGAKHHLPNYGVFDEYRYFVPGDTLEVVQVGGVDVAVVVCEDLWQDGPAAAARAAGAGLLLVVNGSPFERAKDDARLALCRRRAAEAGCTLAYVNMVGGQDELVFDGDSLVVGHDGDVLARAGQFEEGCLLVDLDLPSALRAADRDASATYGDLRIEHTTVTAEPVSAHEPAPAGVAARLNDEGEVYAALVTGLRDYVRKNGFTSVLLGLSGGIDSALTAVVAVDALGAEHVHAVSMPSEYSSQHSRDDAAELARRTGLRCRVVPIEAMVRSFHGELKLTGVAAENVQSRVRGTTLMALSNEEGHLVLATGNKSELAVGYSTMYGDSVGGFAPLKDVPKTWVWRLARWRNGAAEQRGETAPIPQRTLTKPPSAELSPGQLDTDTLPPYEVLDELLDSYVEQDRGVGELIAAGFDPELVERTVRMVDRAEHKRRQYPPGPKISARNFGRDRRLPITSRWQEQVFP